MTNDIKTRRLIVTLPDVSGEEAISFAETIRRDLGDPRNYHSEPVGPLPTVNVLEVSAPARHDSHVLSCVVTPAGFHVSINARADLYAPSISLTPLEARQLAGVLLAHADDIEGLS